MGGFWRGLISGGKQAATPYVPSYAAGHNALPFGTEVDLRDEVFGDDLWYDDQTHVLMFGRNAAGKGARVIASLLLTTSLNSVVVIDPKCEQAAICAAWRRQIGRVVMLNPYQLETDAYEDLASDGFNPLLPLDPSSPEFNSDATDIAAAMIEVAPGPNKFFDVGAHELTTMMTMFEVTRARFFGEVPTLRNVRHLICMASSGGGTDEPVGIPALAEEICTAKNPAGDGFFYCEALRNKAAQFAKWSKTLESIALTARTQTAFLDDPMIAADLSRGTFDFRDMKREPVTVFVSLPPGKLEDQAKWLRLVMTAGIKAGMMRAPRPHEPRCLFIFDELAALGRFDLLKKNYPVARGYGVQFLCALQNVQQLTDCYGKQGAATFIANAGLIASFAPNDLESAKWLSELSGTVTRTVASYAANEGSNGGDSGNDQQRSGWSYGYNLTFSQQSFPLFSVHDLRGLPQGCMVLARAGSANVFLSFAPYYTKRSDCAGRFRPNPFRENVPRRAAIAAPAPSVNSWEAFLPSHVRRTV